MSYVYFNPNPENKNVGDCAIRAFCAATDTDWDTAFIKIILRSFAMKDMPSSDDVWGAQLHDEGFIRNIIPNTCPYCYTVKQW